jgi:hypothetical protein
MFHNLIAMRVVLIASAASLLTGMGLAFDTPNDGLATLLRVLGLAGLIVWLVVWQIPPRGHDDDTCPLCNDETVEL